MKHTHCSYDLGFHAKLVRKPACKVGDTPFAITGYVGNLANMVEHMTACEEENYDKANRRPKIPILNDGEYVRIRHGEKREQTHDDDRCGDDSCIVWWSVNGEGWSIGKVPLYPTIDLFCRLRSILQISAIPPTSERRIIVPSREIIAERLSIRLCIWTSARWEEEDDRGSL